MNRKTEFRKLIRQYHKALYRHAFWLAGDSELAADLVQETYYQAWKGYRGLREPGRGFAWLLSILRRNAYREYRHRDRLSFPISKAVSETIPAADVDIDRLLDLATGLGRLSNAQRDLLLLYALHGFSYEQIGHQLEIPLGTVMSRLARARKALHDALSEVERPEQKVISFRRVGGDPDQ